MRLGWPLAVRWLHDVVLEDLLDRAEDAVGTPPAQRARRSGWVRAILWADRAWRRTRSSAGAKLSVR